MTRTGSASHRGDLSFPY